MKMQARCPKNSKNSNKQLKTRQFRKGCFPCKKPSVIIINNIVIRPNTKPCRAKRKTVQLKGMELQLLGDTATIASGCPVVFDTIVSDQSSSIFYDRPAGQIIITKPGVYYINWWVATNGILYGLDVSPTFSIISSAGHNIRASSPDVTNQMGGNALIAVSATPQRPLTLQLINATDGTIGFGTVPVKADLTIISAGFK